MDELETTSARVTPEEAERLEHEALDLQDTARVSLGAYLEKLAEIRTRRSFMLRGFSNWTDYAEQKFGLERRLADRLALQGEQNARIREALGLPSGEVVVTQRQATVLAKDQNAPAKVRRRVERGATSADAIAKTVASDQPKRLGRARPKQQLISASSTPVEKSAKTEDSAPPDPMASMKAAAKLLLMFEPEEWLPGLGKTLLMEVYGRATLATRSIRFPDEKPAMFEVTVPRRVPVARFEDVVPPRGRPSQPAEKCKHPIARRIGNGCPLCGETNIKATAR